MNINASKKVSYLLLIYACSWDMGDIICVIMDIHSFSPVCVVISVGW